MPTRVVGSKLRPIWSGYLLLFDKQAAACSKDPGLRLLVLCIILEGLIRPSLRAVFRGLGVSGNNWSTLAFVSSMLVLAVREMGRDFAAGTRHLLRGRRPQGCRRAATIGREHIDQRWRSHYSGCGG